MRATLFVLVVIAAFVAVASAAKLSTVSPSKKPLIKTLSKITLPASSKRLTKTKLPINTSTRRLTPWQSHSNDPKWRASYKACVQNNHPPHHNPHMTIHSRPCPL